MMIDDDPLCEWDGPLLPLEDVDFAEMIDHGTPRGYSQHRRWKIKHCEQCVKAYTAYNREKKRQRREKKKMEQQ